VRRPRPGRKRDGAFVHLDEAPIVVHARKAIRHGHADDAGLRLEPPFQFPVRPAVLGKDVRPRADEPGRCVLRVHLEPRGEERLRTKADVHRPDLNRVPSNEERDSRKGHGNRHLRHDHGRPHTAEAQAGGSGPRVRAQRRPARDLERRQDARDRGACDRQQAGVDRGGGSQRVVEPEWEPAAIQHLGLDGPQSPPERKPGTREPDGGRDTCQHQGLCEELRDDPAPGRPERRSHDDLALPRCRAREDQQRHVAAYEDQQQDERNVDGDEGHRQLRRREAEERHGLRVRHHLRPQVFVRLRRLFRHARADGGQFRLCLIERNALGKPAEDVHLRTLPPAVVCRPEPKRRPDVV
jgi:hypothetical protein